MQSHLTDSLISKGIIVISVIIIGAVTVCGCRSNEKDVFVDTGYTEDAAAADSVSDEKKSILVFVCGAVQSEGVYELPEGARVIDAVQAAGGYTDEADRSYINQAAFVYDAQKLRIPTAEEAAELEEPEETAGDDLGSHVSTGGGRININTADLDELMRIPGIGESKARNILSYREEHGRFGSVREIMNVRGIGSSVYEKMKDCITVD